MAELPATLLVANRGEIARRVIRTARRLGVRTVAVHSTIDAELPFVDEADEAVCIGPAAPAESYLDAHRIVQAALERGCDAVHPGYGFLSESAELAGGVEKAGLTWVGPSAEVIELMGDKIRAKALAATAGVPVGAGNGGALLDVDAARTEADRIGFPVMLKASAGGGGIGMTKVSGPDEFDDVFQSTRSRASRSFGSAELLLERYVEVGRHVEVQILGLADGEVVALGDRDCSVQRRHQKVLEESPAPRLPADLRERLCSAAVELARQVGYRNAGTVEFLVDSRRGDFMFLEMNTRLQVEHPVTELVTGIDLVEQQLRVAAGSAPSFDPAALAPSGHAIELRVYAEDSVRFYPAPGLIGEWQEPAGSGVRVDSGYRAGNEVTPYYDPLLAKLCAHGTTRSDAVERAARAADAFVVQGPKTNLPFLRKLLRHEAFLDGAYGIGIVETVLNSQDDPDR